MNYENLKELGYELMYDDAVKLLFVKMTDRVVYRLIFLKNEKNYKHDAFLNDIESESIGEAYIGLKLHKAIGEIIQLLGWDGENDV